MFAPHGFRQATTTAEEPRVDAWTVQLHVTTNACGECDEEQGMTPRTPPSECLPL